MSEQWRYDEQSGSFRRYDGGDRKKSGGEWTGWSLIVLMFVLGLWPVGLILLVMKLKDSPAGHKSAERSYTASTVTKTAPSSGAKQASQPAGNPVAKAAKSVTRTPSDTGKTAKLLQIIGAAVAGLFGVMTLSALGALLSGSADLSFLLQSAALAVGGTMMFFSGRKMRQRRNRIERYLAIMGERDSIRLEELAAVTGRKTGVIEKDIEYLLQKNLLGTGAFYDQGRGILFCSADAYQRYLTERTKKENLTPKEANEGYSGALRAIREANDRIPDPVFSEKLDHMELIAGKIFREVEAHPQKLKQASAFFDYYLPTTLKLLGTYTQFEEAGIEGENLRQAKERIESIMDNLLENFEKQLDELYRSEAMDVDADIRVMENMLSRDLSSVERDFGLGGAAVQRKPE